MTDHSVKVIAENREIAGPVAGGAGGDEPAGAVDCAIRGNGDGAVALRAGIRGRERAGAGHCRGRDKSDLSKRRLKMWIRMLGVTRSAESSLREFLRVKRRTTLPRFDVMAALFGTATG